MKRLWICTLATVGALLPALALALPPLQLYVALTPEGGVLHPPPGKYSGPVVIKRPITIDGGGQVTIDGGGDGTVVEVDADGTVLRGLHITNSGISYDGMDSAVLLKANDTKIENNVIDDSLFGVNMLQANGNVVRNNDIASKQVGLHMRGDGIRIWYSNENLIEGNRIRNVRDLTVTNSSDNRFVGNHITGSRIGMEFIFSPDNVVQNNTIAQSSTGIVVLYSDDVVINGNRLLHLRSAAGSALALKDSSHVKMADNDILHCAVGLEANSPIHPENIFYLTHNYFAYNDIALYFYGEKGGHIIHNNRFEGNITMVAVSAPTSARANDWKGNYWDNYEGFDLDHNGVGDTPYEIYAYADRIWMDQPTARFFRGSPVLELIDFIERLAPLSDPQLVLRDPVPQVPLAVQAGVPAKRAETVPAAALREIAAEVR